MKPFPASTGRPCSSFTASCTCNPAMIEEMVGVVATLPSVSFSSANRLHDMRLFRMGHSVDAFNSSVYPRLVQLPAGTIDPETRFTVVESRNNNIGPGEQSQTKTMDHVRGDGMDARFGKNISDGVGSDVSFAAAYV